MAAMNGPAAPSVLLLSLPWTTLSEPSLGLAILKSRLSDADIACRVRHLNLLLLDYIDAETYRAFAEAFAFNDYLFAASLERSGADEAQAAALATMLAQASSLDIENVTRVLAAKDPVAEAGRLRDQVIPAYLDACLGLIDADNYTMIGLTCLFDQTIASLALARKIKEAYPDKLIVLGGYALEKPVGPLIIKCFPFVDVIALGEGEDTIIPLAEASLDRDRLCSIAGIIYRGADGRVHENPLASGPNLDDSPFPDYDDWFSDITELTSVQRRDTISGTLPLESSRGCWWGEISHCIFCGIDEQAMRYRAKTPSRVKAALDHLSRRYACVDFRFSDYILPMQYYRTLLPDLAAADAGYSLHWEIKSNISRDHVGLMSRAGVRTVQAGIESFSSSVLNKMRKGVSAIRNVQAIKLLTAHRIEVIYNVLYGFPGDEASEYEDMIRVIPSLFHLAPGQTCMPILTVRYSPMHRDPDRFGFKQQFSPLRRYDMIFSSAYRDEIGFDLKDYCYAFERPYEVEPKLSTLYDILRYQIGHWQALAREGKARLSYAYTDAQITFIDSRFEGVRTLVRDRAHSLVYQAVSDDITTIGQLIARLGDRLSEGEVRRVLAGLESDRLVWREGESVLGLALPESHYQDGAEGDMTVHIEAGPRRDFQPSEASR